MIEAFSLKTAHLFGDALASQARLRYRVFVESRKLPHSHYDGMEYDEFDTPCAMYLVWRDSLQEVRGLIRLLPTTRPYMLQTYWPYLVAASNPPVSPRIWEITRVCVDKQYDPTIRLKILPELLCGVQEFFRIFGIRKMIGVARPHLATTYIESNIEWLGKIALIEGKMEAAFTVPTESIRPVAHCRKYGIGGPVLSPIGFDGSALAA